ncbi:MULTISPECIES: T9SS type A sorting domain-containing protein [Flavobacterium]|uniref:T9SS type A sorting domain-containing protein n=1 Tax=Flavobacterium hankyongi TaxID=1176532 RepID=A0ABP9A070_9FLAO|nr:T9SS type A sorting domain-containing protein [Flavobacterium sp. N1846]
MKTKLFLFFLLTALGSNAQCWQKIDSGMYHTVALASNGTLWAWGYNNVGQLGDGTTTNRTQPVQIGTANDWVGVYTGYYHSFAIKSNGTLWGWGQNTANQLGDGSATNRLQPVQIGTATNWAKVSGGENFSAGLKTDGTIWMWGSDDREQMGNGTGGAQATPTQLGISTDNSDIDAGRYHVVLLKNYNKVYTWGHNGSGQIGNGTMVNQNVPYLIPGANNYVKIDGSVNGTVAIRDDGGLFMTGQIHTNSYTAFTQIFYPSVWANVKTTQNNFVGVKSDGTLWAWGDNTLGQISQPSYSSSNTPMQVSGTNYSSNIGINIYSFLVLKSDGSLYGCGQNHVGQLGDNTTVQKNTITAISCPATLSTVDLGSDLNFEVYPNPVKDVLKLSSVDNISIDKAVVYDVSGKEVLEANGFVKELNVEKLTRGYYMLEILSEGKRIVKKLIKE